MAGAVRVVVVVLIVVGSLSQAFGLWSVIAHQRKVSKAFRARDAADRDLMRPEELDGLNSAAMVLSHFIERNDEPLESLGEPDGPWALVAVTLGIACSGVAGVLAAVA